MILDRQIFVSSVYPYRFTFVLCNVFDRCRTSNVQVNVTESSAVAPYVEIIGSVDRTITRATSLSITGIASRSGCVSSLTSPTAYLQVSWQVWNISSTTSNRIQQQSSLKSTSVDKLKFNLPSYSFSVGGKYEIKFVVTDSGSGLRNDISDNYDCSS